MTTVPATVVAMVVLSAAGLLPTIALVGLRWITFPLVPLAGAVIAALAATGFVAVGGTFMVWFVALAGLGAGLTGLAWMKWPDRRPWTAGPGSPMRTTTRYRLIGALGALGIIAACAWCLRDLATPTVGFDARALWLTRSGWFLHSHQQVLTTLRSPALVLGQSAYPPLVSASGAVAWSVTGNHTLRLGVVVIALLNTCALATAAFAVVEFGRRFSSELATPEHRHSNQLASIAPMLAGVVAAVLLIFISFGITEPFMTNGYADPIWSLAALGAVVYGLQMTSGRSETGVVAILLLVAGMSKNEGVVTAAVLIVLVALRQLSNQFANRRNRTEPRPQWWRVPIAVGVVELAAVGAWPVVMRAIGARGQSSPLSTPSQMVSRARATYDGFVPYLHVLPWAVPIAVIGGLVLSGVRSRSGAANDWWGWAGLASGLLAVAGALIVGTSAIEPWLATTVHRVTEFPALTGWWIVAMWAVVASGAPAAAALEPTATPDGEGLPAHLPTSRTPDRLPETVRAPSV
jgi:hypothetical protein